MSNVTMEKGMSIVFGTDFSSEADAALETAAAISHKLGDDLWIVHATDEGRGTKLAAIREEAKRHFARLEAPLRETHAGLRVRHAVVEGSAHRALAEFASAHEARMLVVASQGHGASTLARIGGTSERVARAADCPVLVVREPGSFSRWAAGSAPLRVVLGVGDGASSERAIEFVKLLRQIGRCDITAAHVYYPHEARARYGVSQYLGFLGHDPTLEALVERDVLSRVGDLPGEGTLRVEAKLGVGRLADHLLEVAELSRADLVVVGTHRRASFLSRLSAVNEGALHFGRMAVACVPTPLLARTAPTSIPTFERVIVATDLSPFGNCAVRYAFAIARGADPEVFLIHVADPDTTPARRAEITARLREAVPPGASRFAETRTEVLLGLGPAEMICAAAERMAADAVCIASGGGSGIVRAALGGVAHRVVTECKKPVFIVHPPPGTTK